MKKYILSVVIFLLALGTGFWIAGHKPLWNDEIFTTVSSVHHQSFWAMIQGHIPEGGNAPLFYILQKAVIAVTGYQVHPPWIAGDWGTKDPTGQWVLRIIPVVSMSLSIALLFHFFAVYYSRLSAFLSVFIYLSSYMLWVYWAEARPYALFVLLTTMQLLLLVKRIVLKDERPDVLRGLCLVHVLLALTSILSFGQILAAGVVLWGSSLKDRRWHAGLLMVPLLIIAYYYSQAPRFAFYFDLTPEQLIRDNISRDRFYILGGFVAAYLWLKQQKESLARLGPYLLFLAGVMTTTALVMGAFVLSSKAKGEGFPISSRYFIYLMPVGVMAVTMGIAELWRLLSRWRFIQVGYALLIAGLLLPKFFKIVPRAIHSILGGA